MGLGYERYDIKWNGREFEAEDKLPMSHTGKGASIFDAVCELERKKAQDVKVIRDCMKLGGPRKRK